jgi:hypothetical protein
MDDDELIALADASPLRTYDWPDREYAPPAYGRGMAIAFARAYSMLRRANESPGEEANNPLGATDGDVLAWRVGKRAVVEAATAALGDGDHDVLVWYEDELTDAGAATNDAPAKIVSLFSIMMGLGMRESSGAHCCGADTPGDRGEETTEENAEAGLFQVSHDSVGNSTLRKDLFDAYRGRTDLLAVFAHGVHCSAHDAINHGSGLGADFQRTMKECPLFAALYTALFLRQQRSHWGPINSHHAEVNSDAVELFSTIRSRIDQAG